MLFTQMILAYSWWLWKSRIKTIMVLALQRSFTPEVKFNIVFDLEKNNTFVRKPRRDFRLSTFDSFLMTSDFRLSTFDFRLSTFDFRLSTFDFRLSTFDFRLSTFNFRSTCDFWLLTPRLSYFCLRRSCLAKQIYTFVTLLFVVSVLGVSEDAKHGSNIIQVFVSYFF